MRQSTLIKRPSQEPQTSLSRQNSKSISPLKQRKSMHDIVKKSSIRQLSQSKINQILYISEQKTLKNQDIQIDEVIENKSQTKKTFGLRSCTNQTQRPSYSQNSPSNQFVSPLDTPKQPLPIPDNLTKKEFAEKLLRTIPSKKDLLYFKQLYDLDIDIQQQSVPKKDKTNGFHVDYKKEMLKQCKGDYFKKRESQKKQEEQKKNIKANTCSCQLF